MASLYDLELQESNNFIHLLIQNGESPSLKLLRDQEELSSSMGEAGQAILAGLQDETSDLGKSFKRLKDLEIDVKAVMQKVGMTPKMAQDANTIFARTPDSLEDLTDVERSVIKDYWLLKKMCVAALAQKGYTYQELFS